jgi:hypothetical protein
MGDDSRNILGLGLDGCTDVDECAQQIDACDRRQAPGQPAGTPMQTCVNTWGSYLCLAWNDTKCAEAQGPTAKIKPSQVTLSDEPNRVQTVNADATTPGDSGILSYFWSFNKTKTEGKSAPKLRATTSQSAFVSNIGKKGQYVFQVLVTDMCGKTSTDQVTLVKENGAPTPLPPHPATRKAARRASSASTCPWACPASKCHAQMMLVPPRRRPQPPVHRLCQLRQLRCLWLLVLRQVRTLPAAARLRRVPHRKRRRTRWICLARRHRSSGIFGHLRHHHRRARSSSQVRVFSLR